MMIVQNVQMRIGNGLVTKYPINPYKTALEINQSIRFNSRN